MIKRIHILIANAKQGLLACALTLLLGTTYAQTYTLAFTGNIQTLTLPKAGYYEIQVWGADGGDITAAGSTGGGKGGYSTGIFNAFTPNTQINVFVGGKGGEGNGISTIAGAGGWNGGGGGAAVGKSGAGGGGATDIRVGGTAAANRIIVAGGGGGAAYYNSLAAGGNGGGLAGLNGDLINSATPGVVTPGGGGAGAVGATGGTATAVNSAGTTTGGGGGGTSSGTGSLGQTGTGGGPGGAAGPSGSGSTGSSAGGGGGYAGGAGGVQASNGGVAGGGGSGYVGGVNSGTTLSYAQPGFVYNPEHINGNVGNGFVIIRYKCDVTAQVSKSIICAGEQITLSTDAGSNVQWSHGPTTPTVVVTPTSSTSYTVTGVSSSTTGWTATLVLNVLVSPLPAIAAASLPTVLCQGNTGTLIATGAASYTWSPGSYTGNILMANPSASTIYTVEGMSAYGCYNSSTVAMNVNTNQLVISNDTTVCKGSPAHLHASGATTYSWDFGAPFQNVTVYPNTSTVYSVSAIDEYYCPLSGMVTVVVNPLPTVSVSAANAVVCRGETIQLFANGTVSYKWNTGATANSISSLAQMDIPQHFYVTGTDSKGCSSTASVTVMVDACLSVEEMQSAAIRIMPNPANEQVTIESNGEVLWKITDIAGRIVLQGTVQAGSQSVNVSTLSSGIYMVRLQTGESEKTVKLIKN